MNSVSGKSIAPVRLYHLSFRRLVSILEMFAFYDFLVQKKVLFQRPRFTAFIGHETTTSLPPIWSIFKAATSLQ